LMTDPTKTKCCHYFCGCVQALSQRHVSRSRAHRHPWPSRRSSCLDDALAVKSECPMCKKKTTKRCACPTAALRLCRHPARCL